MNAFEKIMKIWFSRVLFILVSVLVFQNSISIVSANPIYFVLENSIYKPYNYDVNSIRVKSSCNVRVNWVISKIKDGVNDEVLVEELRVAAKSGTNLVYQGIDKAGVVKYIGITERQAAVRFGEHLSSGTARSLLRYDVIPDATNLSRTGARVWEQTLITQYGLGKNGGQLLNKINSIAPKNWWEYGIK